jgi:hypothetical protein
MKNMKRRLSAGAALAFCVSSAAFAQHAPQCHQRFLDGLYVFSATGYTIVAGEAQPKAIVELIRFNGDGTLSVPGATHSINGVVAQSPPNGTGTYTLDADCLGTIAFTGGPSFDIFVSPTGYDLWMIQTNPNNVLQGNVTRVSR